MNNMIPIAYARKIKAAMQLEASAYASFATVTEMDAAVLKHLEVHMSHLSTNTVNVLAALARYSCVAPGASWRKYEAIATDTGISCRTLIRSLDLLESLGIIKRKRMTQGNLKGRCIIVILPVTAFVTTEETPKSQSPQGVEGDKNVSNLLNSFKLEEKDYYNAQALDLIQVELFGQTVDGGAAWWLAIDVMDGRNGLTIKKAKQLLRRLDISHIDGQAYNRVMQRLSMRISEVWHVPSWLATALEAECA